MWIRKPIRRMPHVDDEVTYCGQPSSEYTSNIEFRL